MSSGDALSAYNEALKNKLAPLKILDGIESPRQELLSEMDYIAERIAAITPQEDITTRRGALPAGTKQFQDGMVQLLEEIINGTDEEGKSTPLLVLHRVARQALDKLPADDQQKIFTNLPDGRLHFSEDEIPEVADVKGIKKFGANRFAKGLLKDGHAPISAARGVRAFSGDIAFGFLDAYLRLPLNPYVRDLGKVFNWIQSNYQKLDPQMQAVKNSGIIRDFVNSVYKINDVLEFVTDILPVKLPPLFNMIPTDEELSNYRVILEGLHRVGLTGVEPLLNLTMFGGGKPPIPPEYL